MSNTDFLGRAIDVVKKAVDSDTAGEYEKAYQLYYQARASAVVSLLLALLIVLRVPSRAFHACTKM